MDFSDKVKRVRATLLINQKQLAETLGVSNITICRWEKQGMKPSFLDEKKFEAFCKDKDIFFTEGNNNG